MQPVAFTPKGGCPLKPPTVVGNIPVVAVGVAFTPKGGCPLKLAQVLFLSARNALVAFTPKGGCVADEWLWRCTAQAQCV